jgi:hypothetical protein
MTSTQAAINRAVTAHVKTRDELDQAAREHAARERIDLSSEPYERVCTHGIIMTGPYAERCLFNESCNAKPHDGCA